MGRKVIQWEGKRQYLKIRLEPENVKETHMSHETIIYVNVGDTRYEAVVPTLSLGEDNAYVPAQVVGERDGKLVVVLPVGNDGTTYWNIPGDEIYQVLVE